MGYNMVGEKSDFRFNIWQWPVCLKLAEAFGWKPMGTIDPYEGQPWSGDDYLSNAGQLVTKEDAFRVASALRLAIDATESDDRNLTPEQGAMVRRIANDSGGPIVINSLDDLGAMIKAAHLGEGCVSLAKLRAFVEFCSEGEFRIM
jgi:hypothetical protein